jgi:hypothetical protein
MRYRSATVADFHGLPLYLKRLKERANLRNLDDPMPQPQFFFPQHALFGRQSSDGAGEIALCKMLYGNRQDMS